VDQIFYQGLELGPGQLDVQVLGTTGVGRHVWQVDVGLLAAGQFNLGLLRSFFQTLHGQGVALQVDVGVFLELFHQEVDHPHIEIFTTQEGVTVGGQYFELHFAVDVGNFDDGNIEGTTTQVIDGNLAVTAALVHAISQGCGSRLVDDPLDLQARDTTGILGRLPLGVVEVGRNRDNGFRYWLAQDILGRLLHFLQNFGGNLGRRFLVAFHFNPGVAVVGLDDLVRHQLDVFLHDRLVEAATDQTLDRIQGVAGVRYGLALGGLSNQHFAIFGKRHDGRCGASTFGVLNYPRLVAVQDRHAGVGGAQVDTDCLSHKIGRAHV